jgi:hypothetical protein
LFLSWLVWWLLSKFPDQMHMKMGSLEENNCTIIITLIVLQYIIQKSS